MNPQLLALISLRSAALAAELAGRPTVASALRSAAALIESGLAVDAQLAEVAAKLKERELTDADWSDVANRLHAASTDLHTG